MSRNRKKKPRPKQAKPITWNDVWCEGFVETVRACDLTVHERYSLKQRTIKKRLRNIVKHMHLKLKNARGNHDWAWKRLEEKRFAEELVARIKESG